jgi:hypothetical protein
MITVFVLSMLTYASVVGALVVMIPRSLRSRYLRRLCTGWSRCEHQLTGGGGRYRYRHRLWVLRVVACREEFQRYGDHEKAIEEALMTTDVQSCLPGLH